MSDTVLIDGHHVTVLPKFLRAMVVHDHNDCTGRECVVHNPTEHSMRAFPLHWRRDRGIFERLCPHGVGHPDPDQQAYWRKQVASGEILDEVPDEDGYRLERPTPDEWVSTQMTHGCDGCCV